MRALSLALALGSVLPQAARADDRCAGVTCSDRGECFEENGRPHCLCDAGFAALALACAPSDGEDAALRARRAPGAAARVVALAAHEVGRKRWRVGEDAVDDVGPLTDYLDPYEWWCGDFVAWIFARAGVPLTGGAAGGWLVPDNRAIAAWHAQRGLFVDRSHPDWDTFVPRPGDFVRFRTSRFGHAGIVERVDGDTLHLVEGNVSNAVLRGRYFHWRRDRRIEGFGRTALENTRPIVEAGPDREVLLGEPVVLSGHVEDDGPRAQLRARWAGPPPARFEAPSSPVTQVRFDAPGAYELWLEADDGEHSTLDRVRVIVREPEPEPEPEPTPLAAPPASPCAAAPGARPRGGPALALLLASFGLRAARRPKRRPAP
ncbi:MAG: CHAP domain-containing protein [Sandaracinaceae bacterium]|nr:CHAP domain-containing protein [Sandaracinaceae bacterium]